MKKCILVAAIALLSSPVLMAEVQAKTLVLDSTIFEGAGGKDKTEFVWTASGERLSETYFNWDGVTESWAPSGRYMFTYDAAGNQTSQTYQNWESDDWRDNFGYERKFDEVGNKLEEIYKEWDDVTKALKNVKRDKYTYNGANQVILRLGSGWDAGKWVDYDKYTYDYKNGLLDTEVSYYWNTTKEDFVYSWRKTYTYNANKKVTEILEESYYDDAWHSSNRETFEYDANSNLFMDLKESYNTLTSKWEPTKRWVYTYDANNQVLSIVSSNYDSGVSGFVLEAKQEFAYDAAGNEVETKDATWDGAQWVYNNKIENIFIEGTEFIKKQLYYMYDTGSSSFINTGFNTYYYHEQATAIDRVAAQSANTVKVIRNGQLLIIRDGKTFDMNGKVVE